jgi:hypothetical protein
VTPEQAKSLEFLVYAMWSFLFFMAVCMLLIGRKIEHEMDKTRKLISDQPLNNQERAELGEMRKWFRKLGEDDASR